VPAAVLKDERGVPGLQRYPTREMLCLFVKRVKKGAHNELMVATRRTGATSRVDTGSRKISTYNCLQRKTADVRSAAGRRAGAFAIFRSIIFTQKSLSGNMDLRLRSADCSAGATTTGLYGEA